ncbi:DNA polymerase III subunit gamma/tau [Thalassoglobus polymorphus]|uniref:DNA polymerase III subunit gamma/tau n=1 Tax=Thalassoglobus polymorphus TaxID=2527994 RepID=A0A517QSK9_9PLAN|nr:DNA polymerase III subunit gamma/tau [Thalassoglobus polymorphus]QDT34609.1 DNA polymerase III subunit tau [Thalassoglobus polymorphus]
MVSESTTQYTVLARRFRPQSFEDVVGQGHVGQAIRNAIRSGRVAHAYLFTGARGVGKTSTARIFAKALNCPNLKDGVPCNDCEICASIGEGKDVDVLEIDGASNRGIDDIRQLRANVNVRSMRSPYKVYIIDEVHMLTKEAFNALLKTLEEPPANVKFVFCTTEPNKVPDTILSRCQRFDFGTIAQSSIAERLKQIAAAEKREVDDEAIELVARRAAGSMRDSQSLFDQLLAFGGDRITSGDVHQLLGTASDDRLIEVVELMIARNSSAALKSIDEALLRGVQLGSFSDQLLAYFRDLLITAAGAETVPLSAVSDSSRESLKRQAEQWGIQTISSAMQILAETKSKMQRVNYGRALVELAIVRISLLEDLSQISNLAQAVASGQAIAVATPGSAPVQASASLPASTPKRPVAQVKKNEVTPSKEPSPAISAENPAASPVQTIEFTESTLEEFWTQLKSMTPDTLSVHLKNTVRQAISGPNLLEIVFPKSYLFSKSYCERPVPLKQLEELATQLAGKTIECRFEVDETTQVKVPKPSVPVAPVVERRSPSSVDKDDFVQEAVAIFGGQVVEVRPVYSNIKSTEDEDPEG